MNRALGPGRAGRAWWLQASLAAVAALAVALGGREQGPQPLFGGAMLAMIALAGLLQHLAERPGRDGHAPSVAEKASWQQPGVGLIAILMLGGLLLGARQGVLPGYLFFAAYALVVACYPLMRRRSIESGLRHRDLAEDERGLALRAQCDRLANRLLELGLVAIAVAWVALPQLFQWPVAPVRVALLLLLPILLANVIGEAGVAWLSWRDRQ